MIPYGIHNITFRADNGFFSQEILEFLEKMKFKYIIGALKFFSISGCIIVTGIWLVGDFKTLSYQVTNYVD